MTTDKSALLPKRWKRITDFSSFLERVQKTPSGCWQIEGWHNPLGYGRLRYKGKKYLAHRLAWLLAKDQDPGELLVCHKCDNPGCVKPDHLFLGTNADNIKDCFAKGRNRAPKGTHHGSAVLTESDVLAIRASDELPKNLAATYGVSRQQIQKILRGKKWKHL